jgi:hypothetical protein
VSSVKCQVSSRCDWKCAEWYMLFCPYRLTTVFSGRVSSCIFILNFRAHAHYSISISIDFTLDTLHYTYICVTSAQHVLRGKWGVLPSSCFFFINRKCKTKKGASHLMTCSLFLAFTLYPTTLHYHIQLCVEWQRSCSVECRGFFETKIRLL